MAGSFVQTHKRNLRDKHYQERMIDCGRMGIVDVSDPGILGPGKNAGLAVHESVQNSVGALLQLYTASC